MTRRCSTSPRPTRRRRATAPPRRIARGQGFTTLGFAFFRLISLRALEPGEPRYVAVRMREARAGMAAFVAAT